jgi:uncharacterized membrane protein
MIQFLKDHWMWVLVGVLVLVGLVFLFGVWAGVGSGGLTALLMTVFRQQQTKDAALDKLEDQEQKDLKKVREERDRKLAQVRKEQKADEKTFMDKTDSDKNKSVDAMADDFDSSSFD